MRYLFDPPPTPSIAIEGDTARFPVHRIYAIGRNYADHAREMGAAVDREQPVFFQKPADAVLADGADIPYPPATTDVHHEVELVVALAGGGRDLDPAAARAAIFGYAVGIDLTRRDLQAAAKAKGLPWDSAKGFDASAPIAPIVPAATFGHPQQGRLWLEVDGVRRQDADIGDMVFPVPEILVRLSRLFTLRPGDLVFTGTPAGVGPLRPGQHVAAGFPGLPTLAARVV